MPFVVPSFPLTCNVYTGGVFTNPPRISPNCNLTYGRRVMMVSTGGTSVPGVLVYNMSLLLPAGTDIRGPRNAGGGDGVEVPAGSGRQYFVVFVDDIGKGFANEHRTAQLYQINTWPTPIP